MARSGQTAGEPAVRVGGCDSATECPSDDSDGAQHVIGNVSNFFNAIGLLLPPYATLSVLWERQAKGKTPTREELMEKYEKDYGSTADRLVRQLLDHARS